MRVTGKGQVTIPLEIRRSLGLLPNTEVEFVQRGKEVVLRKARNSGRRGQQVIDALRGKGSVRMTTEQILRLTRGE